MRAAEQVFSDIRVERARQNAKWADSHRAGGGVRNWARLQPRRNLTILVEEIGEVARAIHDHDEEAMTDELVQVGAVVVAWLEGLRGGPDGG